MADTYYDDQKRLIANDLAGLLIYFESLTGVSSATNVVYAVPCPMSAVIQVTGGEFLPKFIYKNGLTPSNKIFLQQLPANNLNINSLCLGVSVSNSVPPPVIGTPVSVDNSFYVSENLANIYTTEIGNKLITE